MAGSFYDVLSNPVTPGQGGTGLSSYATGDLLYASSASALARLAVGTAGQQLGVSGGLPAWITEVVPHYAPGAPAFGAVQSLGAGERWRLVFGTAILAATAPNFAYVQAKIDGAGGTEIQIALQGAGLTTPDRYPFCFGVASGHTYVMLNSGSGGVTETISDYSYLSFF